MPSDIVCKDLVNPKSWESNKEDRIVDIEHNYEPESSIAKVPKIKFYQCTDCFHWFKSRRKLLDHQVDDHYYEDLENSLVGEFIQSTVCCNVDFSKSGFGMYIRHKAEKHGAVQKVATIKDLDISDTSYAVSNEDNDVNVNVI